MSILYIINLDIQKMDVANKWETWESFVFVVEELYREVLFNLPVKVETTGKAKLCILMTLRQNT